MTADRHYRFAFLLLGCALLFHHSPARSTWKQIAQFSHPKIVSAMFFFDEMHGFIGFRADGGILETTDGGVSWTACSVPGFAGGTAWMGDIWFRTKLEGWATYVYGSSSGCLLHTTDGGQNWSYAGLRGNACAVRQTSQALVVTQYGGPGVSVSTDNGRRFGATFFQGIDGVDFVDDVHGAATGFSQNFLVTADGGLTWNVAQTTFINEGWGIYGIKGSSTFVAVPEDASGSNGSFVYKSTDYGQNWSVVTVLPFKSDGDVKGYGQTLYCQKSSDGVSAAADGLYRSTDIGRSWTNVGGPVAPWDSRIAVTGCGNVLYAADANGGLYKSTDGGDGRFVGSGTGQLSVASTKLDLGSAPRCSTRDTQIILSNIGCGPLHVSGKSISGAGFSYVTRADTLTLGIGASDTILVHYDGSQGDTIRATVRVRTLQGADSILTINLTGISPIQQPVRFVLVASRDPILAGDTVEIACYPDRKISGKNLHSITGVLEYYNDAFDLLSVTAGSVGRFTSSSLALSGKNAQLPFSTMSASDLVLDPKMSLFTLRLRRMISDSSSIPFVLDSLRLNDDDPNFKHCVLSSTTLGTISHLAYACGDSLMQQILRGQPLIAVTNVRPNPVTSGTNFKGSLVLTSAENGSAEITLTNVLGATVKQDLISLRKGSREVYIFDLSRSDAGGYSYHVKFVGSNREMSVSGSLILVK